MSEEAIVAIVVSLISAGALMFGTVIKIWWDVRGMKSSVHETREQVQNDHTTGLRDDLDEKHSTQMAALKTISKQLVKSDRRQWEAINRQAQQIKNLDKKR